MHMITVIIDHAISERQTYVHMQGMAPLGSIIDKDAAGRFVAMRLSKVTATLDAFGKGRAHSLITPASIKGKVRHGSRKMASDLHHSILSMFAGLSSAHISKKRAEDKPWAACQLKTLTATDICKMVTCAICASVGGVPSRRPN